MAEAVRLVIWDLDETFWKGTLTEGGILAYVQRHHDIVVELAARGIMSSICSKNDFELVRDILNEKEVFGYFIFPSVNWQSKGPRLKEIIENAQLRASSVMFIDDNPNNRGEAAAFVPDMQLADETFIVNMLEDPRFRGKVDRDLVRLGQYKLLEARKSDEGDAGGDNAEFLRQCDIRVYIEHDISKHLDRAIELINRTNQLNYTKCRLAEEGDLAREELTRQAQHFGCQTGLIRVVDKYGDYGFVGFFMLQNGRKNLVPNRTVQTLVHYCFSCRTLGMLVEHWLYHHLRRPEIDVSGEVLTDLEEQRTVDWISLVQSLGDATRTDAMIAPEIRVHGGCEANAVGHYLAGRCADTKVTGNFAAGAFFVRVNSVSLLLSSYEHAAETLEQEARALGMPHALMGGNFFEAPAPGTLFVFSGGFDAGSGVRYRSRRTGLELRIEINGLPTLDFVAASEDEVEKIQQMRFASSATEEVVAVVRHIRDNYEAVPGVGLLGLPVAMATLFDRVPVGSKLIVLLDDPRTRGKDGVVQVAPWVSRYNDQIRSIVQPFAFVDVISFADVIGCEDDIQIGGNHYDRMAYFRVAEEIAIAAGRLSPKCGEGLETQVTHKLFADTHSFKGTTSLREQA